MPRSDRSCEGHDKFLLRPGLHGTGAGRPDAAQGDVTVHVESAGGTAEALPASDYGFQADGNWHYVSIPTEDFAIDWTQVVAPLALIGAGNEGEAFFVDDVYYGKGEQ